IARRLSRRPNLSPGIPASMDPRIVPQSAAETVIPRAAGDRRNVSVSACVVPAITAVSNPKRSPPSAATTVLFKRYELSFIAPFELSIRFHTALWQLHLLTLCPSRVPSHPPARRHRQCRRLRRNEQAAG